MMSMRKLRRRFKRPKSPYDMQQIKDGKALQRKYGLRRKKEIWIAQETLRKFRQRARELITVRDAAKEEALIGKLLKLGLLKKGATLDDVLELTVENLLERRLQSIIFRSELTQTPLQARQAIVHGHVSIAGRKVPFPSYLVSVEEESGVKSAFKAPSPPVSRGQVSASGSGAAEGAPEGAEKEAA